MIGARLVAIMRYISLFAVLYWAWMGQMFPAVAMLAIVVLTLAADEYDRSKKK